MKRYLAVFLTFVLFLTMIPVAAAEETVYSGTCGENLIWMLDADTGVLEINGSGEMTSSPWVSHWPYIKQVFLSDGITSISSSAFTSCSRMESITIPGSVQEIGRHAFDSSTGIDVFYGADLSAWCGISFAVYYDESGWYVYHDSNPLNNGGSLWLDGEKVETLTIPNGLTTISDLCFAGCSSIKTVIFPDSFKEIPIGAFKGCSNLESVSFPAGLEVIREHAFNSCTSLRSVEIPNQVTEIKYGTFTRCSALEDVVIGDGVTVIETGGDCNAFEYCPNLKSLVLGNSLESVSSTDFHDCSLLESVTVMNPGCSIDYNKNTLGVPGKTVIYGYKDSTAEYYARAFA